MSEQQNVKVVQDAYAAFQRGDIQGLLNSFADNIVWTIPGPKDLLPFAGQRTGRGQVAQFFATLAQYQEPEQFEPRTYVAQGDTVVALGRFRWRVKSNGVSAESDFAHVFTIRNGKVAAFNEFTDTHAIAVAYSTQAAAR
jgi:uncharacterized protein